MNWKEYENEVVAYLETKFIGCRVQKNVKLPGKLSRTPRQIDVLIEQEIGDMTVRTIVEARHWKSKLNVKHVGAFIDQMKDVGVTRGIMFAPKGYSKAAYERALSEPELQLHILDFDSMPSSQGFYANPYRGDAGVFISAPTGWVVESDLTESERENGIICLLHPMGLTRKELRESMYFNLIPQETDIENLIDDQNAVVKNKDPKAEIQMWQEQFDRRPVFFREIYYHNDNYTEFTAFVSANRFHAFLVSSSSNRLADQSLARLRYVIKNAVFVLLHGVNPENSDESWGFVFGVRDEKSPESVLISIM